MEVTTIIFLLSTIVFLLYLLVQKKFSYWKDRNVDYLEPVFFFGNLKEVMKRNVHLTEVMDDLYQKVKSKGKKYGGVYAFFAPQFVPVDLDLIKSILIKDFWNFPNHGQVFNEKTDPISAHLFNLEDDKWKDMRAKLTPTFTSGKMKMMFQTMVECTGGLQQLLNKSAAKKEPIDIKYALGCFTTDVIGSVAFGLDIKSLENPDSDFRKYGNRVFTPTLRSTFAFILFGVFPEWLSKFLGVSFFDQDTSNFYLNLVKNTVEYREKNNVYRKDFMHLLIQLKNIGKVGADDDRNLVQKNKANVGALTLNQITAQAFVFFAAGFETSATTMSFALLELAQRQDIQEKVREEVNRVLVKHDNKLTFECLMEMEYLEKVILETLRIHPPVGVLPRICTKRYNIPGSDLVIEPGVTLSIPVFSIHRDPEFYPNPEVFDPERFNEENKAKRHPVAFMPFGEGPRTCIGLRFGKLQSKVGLCFVLKNYKITLNEKTKLPIKYDLGFVSSVKGGVWLNLEPISPNVK
ncbi:hypothetical protein C4B38_000038 [Diabrotica virgifera virgifera]|uniref:Probable cytochrome P450 6a13 n=1 Tax=Diabrotica virgifera virgifera TaxID=50390 RepID=A0A6P7F3W0_DIAVI|nr:hypothetical protein C4B38_000038 [Diabrotica virgifera virgifera]